MLNITKKIIIIAAICTLPLDVNAVYNLKPAQPIAYIPVQSSWVKSNVQMVPYSAVTGARPGSSPTYTVAGSRPTTTSTSGSRPGSTPSYVASGSRPEAVDPTDPTSFYGSRPNSSPTYVVSGSRPGVVATTTPGSTVSGSRPSTGTTTGSRPSSTPSYTVSGSRPTTVATSTPSYTVSGSRPGTTGTTGSRPSSTPSYTVSGSRPSTVATSTPSYTVSGSRPSSTPSYTVPGSRPTTVVTTTPTPKPAPICSPIYPRDIDGHWSEIYVRRLYQLCVLQGYVDQTFRPNQYISRAELTKMALAAARIGQNLNCATNSCGTPFTDLQGWQGPWVRSAWDLGIIQGYSNNNFAPNQNITRAESVKIILATFHLQPIYTDHSFFNDVQGWAVGWIEKAHLLGFIQGIGNGNFDPDRSITRAEAAKVIAKTLEYFAYQN
ncbi:MAG: S-layer homology domain-containing protein [Candidatus Gracilibacteria bacterium]|jgi:hypothetical protein